MATTSKTAARVMAGILLVIIVLPMAAGAIVSMFSQARASVPASVVAEVNSCLAANDPWQCLPKMRASDLASADASAPRQALLTGRWNAGQMLEFCAKREAPEQCLSQMEELGYAKGIVDDLRGALK